MTPQEIRSVLTKQRFADWYNSGRFDKWISGDADAPSDSEIDNDITELFLSPNRHNTWFSQTGRRTKPATISQP